MIYESNYLDLILGGIIGFLIGKFGDLILLKGANLGISIKKRRRLKEAKHKQFSNILALDHAETGSRLSEIKIQLVSVSLFYSPSIESQGKFIWVWEF